MTKQELLDLLDDDITEAMMYMDKFFLSDPLYKDLNKEFIRRPGTYTDDQFRERLQRFVSMHYKEPERKQTTKATDFYGLLCQLNFNTQKQYFSGLYQASPVCAFLLYGNEHTEPDDVRWLYNQLVTECLKDEDDHPPPVYVDFNGHANSNFKALFDVMCARLGVPEDKRSIESKKFLRKKIEESLKAGPLFIIVKYPGKRVNIQDFYKEFQDLFDYLDEDIATEYGKSLIFFFIEDSLERYPRTDDHFIWYSGQEKWVHIESVLKHPEPRIVDLAPIENMSKDLVMEWLLQQQKVQEIRSTFPVLRAQVDQMLCERKNPYHIIRCLYQQISGKPINLDEWLKH